MEELKLKYLERLSDLYPSIAKASTEIINLQAILNLPKATEHFLTDIHGEYEAFAHVLKNGSGSIRRKIGDVFGNTLSARDKQSLATLIYYPQGEDGPHKESGAQHGGLVQDHSLPPHRGVQVYHEQIHPVQGEKGAAGGLCLRDRGADHGEAGPAGQGILLQRHHKQYHRDGESRGIHRGFERCHTAADGGSSAYRGDIYDRGPAPHIIMDRLMEHHSVDIQWGNHDVLWMGAAAGQRGCIANVIRICARYGNLDILEGRLRHQSAPPGLLLPWTPTGTTLLLLCPEGKRRATAREQEMEMKMHKAISIIQFKAEGQIIRKNPGFKLEKRNLLHHIDFEAGTIEIDGHTYELLDRNFPTVDLRASLRLLAGGGGHHGPPGEGLPAL